MNRHAITIGGMLGGAAALFTLAAFPSLLLGVAFGVLAGIPAALLVLVTTRRPQPAANDTDAWGEGFSPCTPARYEPLTAAPAAVEYDDGDEDEDGDELDNWGDEPWLVAEDWPKRQAAQTEPLPLVVNWTAARFAALELKGGA